MNSEMPAKEGFVSFRGYNVWYRIVGDREASGRFPLLCLHGGPGASWDYFEPPEAMAGTGRRVIFYDQLGCGNSNVPTDPSIYTRALYFEEVGVVRHALGLGRMHILGHSWGSMLAMEYALTQPGGESLTLADTGPACLSGWQRRVASSPNFHPTCNKRFGNMKPPVRLTPLSIMRQAGFNLVATLVAGLIHGQTVRIGWPTSLEMRSIISCGSRVNGV
jgi:pimeloyl-ACP methyl ester carboxylesterase